MPNIINTYPMIQRKSSESDGGSEKKILKVQISDEFAIWQRWCTTPGAPNSAKFRGVAEVAKIDATICHNLGKFLKRFTF